MKFYVSLLALISSMIILTDPSWSMRGGEERIKTQRKRKENPNTSRKTNARNTKRYKATVEDDARLLLNVLCKTKQKRRTPNQENILSTSEKENIPLIKPRKRRRIKDKTKGGDVLKDGIDCFQDKFPPSLYASLGIVPEEEQQIKEQTAMAIGSAMNQPLIDDDIASQNNDTTPQSHPGSFPQHLLSFPALVPLIDELSTESLGLPPLTATKEPSLQELLQKLPYDAFAPPSKKVNKSAEELAEEQFRNGCNEKDSKKALCKIFKARKRNHPLAIIGCNGTLRNTYHYQQEQLADIFFTIGLAYKSGTSLVEQDSLEARNYFEKARYLGHEQAGKECTELDNVLHPNNFLELPFPKQTKKSQSVRAPTHSLPLQSNNPSISAANRVPQVQPQQRPRLKLLDDFNRRSQAIQSSQLSPHCPQEWWGETFGKIRKSQQPAVHPVTPPVAPPASGRSPRFIAPQTHKKTLIPFHPGQEAGFVYLDDLAHNTRAPRKPAVLPRGQRPHDDSAGISVGTVDLNRPFRLPFQKLSVSPEPGRGMHRLLTSGAPSKPTKDLQKDN